MRKSHARNQYKLSRGLEGAAVNLRWLNAPHIAGRSISWNKRSRGTRNGGSTYLLTMALGQRRIQLVSHCLCLCLCACVPACVRACVPACVMFTLSSDFQGLFLQSEILLLS